jgi:hypothetical protein
VFYDLAKKKLIRYILGIGFCISGQPRGTNEIIENHSDFINRSGSNSFMHLWWDKSHEGTVIRYHSSERFPSLDMSKICLDEYNPLKYRIEDYIKFDTSFLRAFNYQTWGDLPRKFYEIFTPWVVYNQKCQSYSVMESTRMCLESSKCNIAMRMRSDSVFTEDKALNIFRDFNPEEDKIYFQSSMSGGHKYSGEHPSKPCDWFYCGTPEAVYKFSETWFNSIDTLYAEGVIHANEAMSAVAVLANLNLVLLDFGVIVHRQLSEETKNFVHWQKYLDDFDSNTSSIVKNIDEWPCWVKNVDFSGTKNF